MQYWIRFIGAHLQANWGAGEGKGGWQVDNCKVSQHLEGRGCFLLNKDARSDQNTELNAMEHKNLTDFICEYTKRGLDGGDPGWGCCPRDLQEMLNLQATLKSQISAPPMPMSTVTHCSSPFISLPTTCTPQMMSLLHHRCLGMGNWFPLLPTRAQEHPSKMETMELQGFTAHIPDKVLASCFPYLFKNQQFLYLLPFSLQWATWLGEFLGNVYTQGLPLSVFGLLNPVTVHSALPNCSPINFPLH